MKKLLVIALVFLCFSLVGQEYEVRQHVLNFRHQVTNPHRIGFLNYDPFFDTLRNTFEHSVFKPAQQLVFGEREVEGYSISVDKSLVGETFVIQKSNEFNFFPVVNQLVSHVASPEEEITSFRSGLGVGALFNLSQQFYFRGTITANYYERDAQASLENSILPNTYFFNGDQNVRREVDPRFRASYTPNRFFNFQAGIDHNFIGEGDRSMLQGDYIAPAPFAQIRSKIWKIEFLNLYQFFREEVAGETLPKFAASHMVNFQATERFQIGLFESVVFMPKDDNWTRGFEMDYLNPFLFYRPQAYSIGSQDRLLIGTNMSYNFGPLMLYGQFALDEFVLGELLGRTRWWGNKYAGQLGFKGKAKTKKTLITYRSELNFARPFTYSHINESTTYGHQGIPLAHPLGANFVESFSTIAVAFKNSLRFEGSLMLVRQGGQDSQPGLSYGNNIYDPYTDRPEEYGFFIGENGQLNRARASLEVSYEVIPSIRLQAFVKPMFEIQRGITSQTFPMIFGGIRTNLWNERSFSF